LLVFIELPISREQIQAMRLSNGPQSLGCYAWMQEFFKMMGDSMPNVDEIHLEPIEVKEIYAEYVDDAKSSGSEWLCPSSFVTVWKNLFSHVKIREFKAVSGKCSTCAKLSDARKMYKDQSRRTYITEMHYLHRSAYMNERMKYAERRQLACKLPKSYLSIIIDGMAQNHCKLPWYGNLKDSDNTLPQHLQGVLNHGRGFTIYRTFHNVRGGANLAIHCFLSTLEDTIKEEGCLPETIFLQIDGGSENTAKSVLGVCELLTARRICNKIVITRLIVGHTHEDIDAVFAKIWKALRDLQVISPQAYEEIMRKALKEKKNLKIKDIFVLPDYVDYFQPLVDTQFSNYSKGSNTQLQFTFEAVTPSEFFPHGVKVTYRAYAADSAIKIIENINHPCGFEAVNEETVVYPEKKVLPNGTTQPEGMYILRKLPNESSVMKPMGFLDNSREFLVNTANKIHKDLAFYNAKRAQDWVDFVEKIAPQTNDVAEYLQEKGMHIPMRDILFSNSPIDYKDISTINSKKSLPTVKTVPTVRWSGNNVGSISKKKESSNDVVNTVTSNTKEKRRNRKNSEAISVVTTINTSVITSAANGENTFEESQNDDNETNESSRNSEMEQITESTIEDLGDKLPLYDSNNTTSKVSGKKKRKASAPTHTDTPVPGNGELATENGEETAAEENNPRKKTNRKSNKEYSVGELLLIIMIYL